MQQLANGRIDSATMGTEEQAAKKPKDDEMELKFNWKLRPILTEELIRQPPLEKSFIGILKDKRSISKAIGCLASCLSCPQYLKRCFGLKIYLCPVQKADGNPEYLKKFLAEKSFDLSVLEDNLEIAEVPSVPPKTRAQMAYASKFWPMNFHPDLALESLISGSLFSSPQLSALEVCMKLAISAAEAAAVGLNECNGSALIIDPWENKILAIASSRINEHPMWHASMLAVDLVANSQGGGAWKLPDDESLNNELNTKRKHPVDVPLRYPTTLEIPQSGIFTFEGSDRNKTEECGPYLCTGYWAVLLQEPCPLCAMALLHSRVSRIFYGAANLQTGILGSKAVLHSVPGLNHRYQVWSSLLEEQCIKTLDKCQRIEGSFLPK